MRAKAIPAPTRKGKRHLLESCAIAAGMAALALGGPALAQVAGSGTVTTLPAGTTVNTGANPSTVNVNGPQSIVDWTPSNTPVGGVIDFLPAGNTLNFVGNTPDYIVLNRFVSASGLSITDQIALNGTVNSYVGATTGPRGGNIWFSNAGGILIGATGVINVGSLVLTANTIDTSGGLLGPGNTIRFRGPAGTSAVAVNGAINANNVGNPGSSYVALVAPRVVQAGTVRVDGSAAYVAAEQADVRINGGLFDINVLVGAEGGNVITHTGNTTGPAHQDGDTDQNRIYMVAIPKNDAVTMLVSGQVGYDDALSAQVDPDGAVRLSAGYNVTNGELNATPANATAANITVNDTLFRSNTIARASGAFVGQPLQLVPTGAPGPVPPPPEQGRIFVEGDGTFIGDASATFNVGTGQIAGATGNFTVQSGGVNGTPGSATIDVNGGLLSVGGNLTVDAQGAMDPTSGFSQGGAASLIVTNGGLVGAVGNVIVTANGIAGFDGGGNGANGVGGTATISVSGTGSTLTGSIVRTSATGLGGGVLVDSAGSAVVADNGGDGIGGNAIVSVRNGGSVTATTSVEADASGEGRTGLDQSGDGQGGTAHVEVTGNGTSLQTPGTLAIARGTGGGSFVSPSLEIFQSQNAGNGRGGSATLSVDADGSATVNAGSVAVITSGFGGNAGGENSAGGDGQGGTASVTGAGGATVQFDDLAVLADGNGGDAISPSFQTALSGDGIGGTVNVTAMGGTTLAIDTNLVLVAAGVAPTTDNIGSANGGTIIVSATNNGNINVNGLFTVKAFAGIADPLPRRRSSGGSTGGDIDLTADGGGAIRAANYLVNAGAAVANASGSNGAARGGTIDLTASSNGQILVTGTGGQSFNTSAITGVSADGSSATGGTIQLIANGGVIDMGEGAGLFASGVSGGALNPGPNNPEGRGGSILIQLVADTLNSSAINLGDFGASSDGRTEVIVGSEETPPIIAGSGQGGSIGFDIQGGTLTAAAIEVSADGFGGNAAGGNTGFGGTATFTQTGGDANVGDMTISANGFGGVTAGQSGSGVGGTATIDLLGGTITGADIIATANGQGGQGSEGNDDDPANIIAGGQGGNALGGNATINIDGTAVVNASIISANAAGIGGVGGGFVNASSFGGAPGPVGNGGDGVGGNALVEVRGGTTTASSIIADASGIGGDGGSSFFSSSSGGATGVGVGGRGGIGQGGTATVALQTAIDAVGTVSSIARGIGGNGGDHNVGGAGGDGFGGIAQAIVTNFDAGQLAVALDTTGLGGNGADGRDGAGGEGGDGIGGTSRLFADGPNASVTVTAANFITGGTGGNGGNAQLGFGSLVLTAPSGGHGGDGRGGTTEVIANEGATVSLAIPAGGGGIVFDAISTGGNGGNGADSVFDAEALSGDGGFGGGGYGGTVRLLTNGGTITSNGAAVEINATGAVGTGGAGGIGQGGGSDGAAGGSFGTVGGRVTIEALNGLTGPGQIALGNTAINANGDIAGRIELRAEGNLGFLGLGAQALGFADPTNNNTDVAPAGIFLALNGGTIASQGDVVLTTDSSVGAYAQSNGIFDVDGTLTINAGDQVDIRHEFREGLAPTIRASGSLFATALTSISGAPGSLLGAGDTLSLTTTGTTGGIGVDRLGGVNIILGSNGAVSVEHAEATNDFTANGASFRTGLNSIITGGDISVTSTGAVDLGNSTAGGFVSVEGQRIAFDTIGAGTTVSLHAQGFGAGDGIDGNAIATGGDVALTGRTLVVDNIQTDGSLSASASNGQAILGSVNTGGDIAVFANGNVIGTFASGGNIRLRSTADITAAANATGGYVDPTTGLAAEGSALANADGNLSMAGSSAATMFGVRAGGSVALENVTAGEDVFVLAGTTANLTAITAGDDLSVRADGAIDVRNSQTTGAGPDGRSVVYQACCSNPIPFLQIQTSTADLSNVTLLAPTSTIDATNVTAFDNFTATAGGAVTTTGLIRSGLATNITGSSLDLVAITAGTDIVLTANAGGVSSTGALAAGHDLTIDAAGNVGVSELNAGDDIRIDAGGTLAVGAAYSFGTGVDDEVDGSNIVIAAGATNVDHAEADNDFVVNAASFRTGLNSIIAGGNIDIVTTGASDLGNATAGGSIAVDAQSIAFNALDAGTTIDLTANGTTAGLEGIDGGALVAGGDINLDGNSIAITGSVTGDASFSATGSGGSVAINQANLDGAIAVVAAGNLTGTYAAGGNIRLNSGANIDASATASGTAADGNLFVDAAGNVVLANSTAARMFGVNADGSATITGASAGEDFLALAGTTASLTNITAGDDVDIRATGNVIATNVRATGAGADTHLLNYLPTSGFTIMQGEGVSSVNGSDVFLSAGGSIDASALSAGDDIVAIAGGAIGIAGADTLGLGATGGGSNIRTQGGDTALSGIDAFNDVLVDATGLANLTGPVAAGRGATINAGSVSLAALTDTGGNAIPTLSAGGDVVVNSAAGITGGGIRALGDAALTAGTAIDIASIEGQDVTLTGAAGITVDAASVLGTTTLDSSDGDVRLATLLASGPINASANRIRIESGGDMHFATLATDVGDAYVRGGGDFSVASGTVAGTADLGTQGEAMNIGGLTAADAIIENTGGFLNLDTVTIAGSLDASARTALGITGVVTGQSISLASASIDIASTGRVGTAGTTEGVVIANNNSDNQTFIGGTGTPDGYHLDADELTRVFGTDIEIFAPEVEVFGGLSVGSATPPDVIVDGFTMTGGTSTSNLGANGALTIRTPGKMRVIGNVQLTGLTDANALNLFADQALEVILGQGTVRLVSGANPAGRLNMVSDDIIVATEAAIADVGAAATTDAIETRLAENDGVLLDEGALFARGIRAEVVGGFYVQNSGTGTRFANRRGLTFGAGGLDVLTEGPSRIVINGVQLGPNGQVTGLDTIPLLTIAGTVPAPGSFDPRSTFNGCLITGAAACTILTLESNFPVQDVIGEEASPDGDDGDGNILPTPLITMRDLDPLSGEPLLDDPVTGAGNDDLWTPTLDACDPTSASGGTCPAAE